MRVAPPLALACLLFSALARAQTPGVPEGMPLVVDLQKVEVGSWAEYRMAMGSIALSSRWALVARSAKSITIEMSTKGEAMGKPVTLRMVLPADPTSSSKPRKPLVIQFGDEAPMLAPKDTGTQKFVRPDAKDLVGSEDLKVTAGSYKTSHYRDKNAMGTVDIWVNDTVFPLGIVKVVTRPEPDDGVPAAMQVPVATMELMSTGKGAKPVITKRPKPFDPKKMGGLVRPR
jgi:hypothetical protein